MSLAGIFRLAAVVSLVLGASQIAFAQTAGALVGTVADAQGATVPGATVTLVSESRGIAQTTQGSPMTYMVGGKQYIALPGTSSIAAFVLY